MKKMILATLIIAGIVIYTVWQTSTYKNPAEVERLINTLKSEGCSSEPPRENIMLASKLADIRRLGELESLCSSKITDIAYVEVAIPNSTDNARVQAGKLAENILEYREYDIKPIVFMEASSTWKNSDFNSLQTGTYDKYLEDFLNELINSGVSEEDIYGWVLIPRPNLPLWGGTNISPEFFSKYYNNLSEQILKVMPDTKTGVYFSATTHEEAPINFMDPDYRSLAPYLNNIDPEMVSIVGIEGFPWMAALDEDGTERLSPGEYLPRALIDELHALTNFEHLIVGTGTFSVMYSEDLEGKVIVPAEVRKEILDATVETLKPFANKNYKVLVLLEASDDRTKSGTDWSYFGTQYTENQNHQKVLLDFLRQWNKAGGKVMLSF